MSSFVIDILTETDVADSVGEMLRALAVATLEREEAPAQAELSVLLTDEDRLRQLNRDFRGLDAPTDVLSFPQGTAMPGPSNYLGDIAIAVPIARMQAEAAGHSLAAELALLTVHGVLHLLGHDHAAPDEAEAMWAAQAEVLALMGIELTPAIH